MTFGTVIVLSVAGLVYDGGLLISSTRSAINDAEQAARAGAQAIDVASLYADGSPTLDPALAVAAAEEFLAANGWEGTAVADATSVTVTIRRRQPMVFLSAFGLPARTITGTATATTRQGYTTA